MMKKKQHIEIIFSLRCSPGPLLTVSVEIMLYYFQLCIRVNIKVIPLFEYAPKWSFLLCITLDHYHFSPLVFGRTILFDLC